MNDPVNTASIGDNKVIELDPDQTYYVSGTDILPCDPVEMRKHGYRDMITMRLYEPVIGEQ